MRVYLTYQGNCMEIPRGETLVGRSLGCRMRFNDSSVSRKHLTIVVDEYDVVTAIDLRSHNGSYLNGKRIRQPTRLEDGDEVMVGKRRFGILIARDESILGDVPTKTLSQMPDVDPPDVQEPDPSAVQRCPECRQAVSTEQVLCDHCGYSWADFRPRSVTQEIEKIEEPESRERRRHQRHEVELPVLYNSSNLTVESMALNLSRSGVFVRTQILDVVGTTCGLTLLTDGGPALTLPGRVSRVVESDADNEPLGLGIEFSNLSANARRWLDDTLARISTSRRN